MAALAQLVQDALLDMKGQEVVCLDVRNITSVTDHMIICTGTSNRHVKSLTKAVTDKAKASGQRPLGVEGEEDCEWVLVDLGDVVVHIMLAATRSFYRIEDLWTHSESSPS